MSSFLTEKKWLRLKKPKKQRSMRAMLKLMMLKKPSSMRALLQMNRR